MDLIIEKEKSSVNGATQIIVSRRQASDDHDHVLIKTK